jgi:hypothetical protein
MENTSKFKWRSFVSMTIFFFIIILVATGIMMPIIEGISEKYETVESIPLYLKVFSQFVDVVHTLTGFSFGILSIVHIVLNWKSLKNYFGKKISRINKEAIFAFSLPIFFIIIGFIVALVVDF